MKIASQTSDEMILKDSGVWRLFFGVGLMILGIAFGYFMFLSGTNNGVPYIVPAVPFIFGLLWTLFFPSIMVDINKSTGQIIYTRKRTIGNKVSNYMVADVARVETRKNWSTTTVQSQRTQSSGFSIGSPGASRREFELTSQSVLVFKDGKELPLDNASGGTPSLSTSQSSDAMTERESGIAKKVADFLGVPFQEIEPPQMQNVSAFGQNGAIQA
jgi:hypothetical protein